MGFARFGGDPDRNYPDQTKKRNADSDANDPNYANADSDDYADANYHADADQDATDDADADSAGTGAGTDDDPPVWNGSRFDRARGKT